MSTMTSRSVSNLYRVLPTQQKDFSYIYILAERGQSPIKEPVNAARCLIRDSCRELSHQCSDQACISQMSLRIF